MEYRFEDLIDIEFLQDLQNKLNAIYSFPSAILDNDGKILTSVAWQDICTKFHRTNPECSKECIKSDKYIFEHLDEADPSVSYLCPHGLIDSATPIVIDGRHLGNFFTGQFFLAKPDLKFFRRQAKKYGFDEKAYLNAVKKVPIWTRERLELYVDFIKGFIELIAGMGLRNLSEVEINTALKESERRNSAILQSTSDWIWETDEEGHYKYCSGKVEEILGYTADEIIGISPGDLMDEEERDRVKSLFQIHDGKEEAIVDFENSKLHKDGHKVDLLLNSFPKFDEDGKLTGNIGAEKDISKRKQAEQELKSRMSELTLVNEELEQYTYANQELKQFAYTASHQLKEPIRTVANYTQIMEEVYSEVIDAEGIRFLHIIREATNRMAVLIDSLMEFSQLGRNKKLVRTDCNRLIRNVISDLEYMISTSNVLIEVDEMPVLNLYEVEIRQLFQNLILNAIKFQKNDIRPEIRIRSEKVQNNWRFSISDNGIGISPAHFERIFDIFQRLHNGEDQFPGMGIGLAYCKKIVQLHQGVIWVESKLGIGSTFYFTLPDLMPENLSDYIRQ
jgi:PAS domain S-box-containing protein